MIETDATKTHPFPFMPAVDRAEGLHLSDILAKMREEWLGEKYPPRDELTDEELMQQRLTWEQGFIWETALSVAFSWPLTPRWTDIQLDGIWLNPDHRFRLDDGWVDEFKYTKRSANQAPSSYLPYMWQNKAYAYVLSTEDKVYNGRFYVLHADGDYRGNRNPIYKCWQYEYCWQELYENWQAILNFATARRML